MQWISILWPLVTGIFNSLVYFRTKESWEAFQAAHPGLAKIIRLLRAFGLHPRKGYQVLSEKNQ